MRLRTDNRGLVGKKVRFNLSYARRTGTVIKNNEYTIIVEFLIGASEKVIIKRHKHKHNVRCVDSVPMIENTSTDVMWETGGSSYAKSLLE